MTRNPKGPRASPAVKIGVPILRKDARTQSVRSASVSRGNLVARASVNQFPPTLGDIDLHLFGEGRHERIYEKLGAHVITHEGKRGVAFAVWAPNAAQVSVVGNFNGWDGKENRMRRLSDSGVWEVFIPGLRDRELYKYEIKHGRRKFLKADPYAFMMEVPPDTSSRITLLTSSFCRLRNIRTAHHGAIRLALTMRLRRAMARPTIFVFWSITCMGAASA